MNKIIRLFLIFILGGVAITVWDGFFILPEGQQAVITQFGAPVGEPVTKAGLKFKTPFIQIVQYFDKRVLVWDGDPNQIPTNDKTFIYMDNTARWRIIDPLRFLQAVGFTHGLFNMEFFYDAATGKLTVIEFNPRLAAQFSDLYLRVDGIDLHRVALELAYGRDPARLPKARPTAGMAASLVYRAFAPDEVPAMPSRERQAAFHAAFPDALLFRFPKPRGSMTRCCFPHSRYSAHCARTK